MAACPLVGAKPGEHDGHLVCACLALWKLAPPIIPGCRIMSGNDDDPFRPQLPQVSNRLPIRLLLFLLIARVLCQCCLRIGGIGCQQDFPSIRERKQQRLVSGRMAIGRQQPDCAVPEQVQFAGWKQPLFAGIVLEQRPPGRRLGPFRCR